MKLIYPSPIIKFEESESETIKAVIRWIDHMNTEEYSAIQDAFGVESFDKLYYLLNDLDEFVFSNLEDVDD